MGRTILGEYRAKFKSENLKMKFVVLKTIKFFVSSTLCLGAMVGQNHNKIFKNFESNFFSFEPVLPN